MTMTQSATEAPEDLFEEFYWQYRGLVRSVLSKRGVHYEQDLDDLVQITFIKAWISGEFLKIEKVKSWIAMIARNTALDFIKSGYQQSQINRRYLEDNEFEAAAFDESADEERAMIEESDTIDEALERLAPDDRKVMRLLLQDYYKRDIREVMGLTELEVRARVKRALYRFAHHYRGELKTR